MVKKKAKKSVKPKAKKAVKKKVKKKAAKKKPAKKKAAKKKAVKKKAGISVTISSKILGRAPRESHFVLSDGKTLTNLMDLADSLRHMDEEIFKGHVNEFKNDFASWIHHVFEEPDFADELRKVNNKIDTEIACLRKLISELKNLKH